jgi:hypothetical protein
MSTALFQAAAIHHISCCENAARKIQTIGNRTNLLKKPILPSLQLENFHVGNSLICSLNS